MQNPEKKTETENSQMTKTIGQLLFDLNRTSKLAEDHSIYVSGCQIGKGVAFPGNQWYVTSDHASSKEKSGS